MRIRRRIGQKGQIVIPKVIREYAGIRTGDEVIMEVREREIIIRSGVDPKEFIESFCLVPGKKLTKKLTWKGCWNGRLRRGLLYVDSNVFLYPIVYDSEVIVEAKKSRGFSLKIAQGNVEACTATVTWDEIAWVIRKVFVFEFSVEEGKSSLLFLI